MTRLTEMDADLVSTPRFGHDLYNIITFPGRQNFVTRDRFDRDLSSPKSLLDRPAQHALARTYMAVNKRDIPFVHQSSLEKTHHQPLSLFPLCKNDRTRSFPVEPMARMEPPGVFRRSILPVNDPD